MTIPPGVLVGRMLSLEKDEMSQLTPYRGLLMNLRGEIPENHGREYLPRERALELLQRWTGQDFGLDADRSESWLRANVVEFRNADN